MNNGKFYSKKLTSEKFLAARLAKATKLTSEKSELFNKTELKSEKFEACEVWG